MNLGIALLRIVLAIILGGIIGFERQLKQHPAGLRTHILVSMGAALVMILSEFIFEKYYTMYGTAFDPTRLGAQVISGIGFLGAGTIIYSESKIKGLTTAASLWAVACVGLTVGAGFYFIATISAILIYVILFIFNNISHKIDGKLSTELMIVIKNDSATLGKSILMFNELNINIEKLHIDCEEDYENSNARLTVNLPSNMNINAALKKLSTFDGIISIEKL